MSFSSKFFFLERGSLLFILILSGSVAAVSCRFFNRFQSRQSNHESGVSSSVARKSVVTKQRLSCSLAKREIDIAEETNRLIQGDASLSDFLAKGFEKFRPPDGVNAHMGGEFFKSHTLNRMLKVFKPPPQRDKLELVDPVERLAIAALLGECLGGPKVYSVGRIQGTSANNRVFLESELLFKELFPLNIKNVPAHNDTTRRLGLHSNRVKEQLSAIMIESVSHGIVMADPQFLIAENGDLRMIDSDLWELSTEAKRPWISVFKLLELMNKKNRHISTQITDVLIDFVQSPGVPVETRSGFCDVFDSKRELGFCAKP